MKTILKVLGTLAIYDANVASALNQMNVSGYRPPKHENLGLEEGKEVFKFDENGEISEHLTVDDTPLAQQMKLFGEAIDTEVPIVKAIKEL